MSVVRSARVPFQYGSTQGVLTFATNVELYTEYDSNQKKTFVYRYNAFGSGKPLATIDQNKKIELYKENGSIVAPNDDDLARELTTNNSLKQSLDNETRYAVKKQINPNDPASVTDKSVDTFMGITSPQANDPTPPAPVLPSPEEAAAGSSSNAAIDSGLTEISLESRESDPNNNASGNYVYPQELGTTGQDYVKFLRYTYKTKGIATGSALAAGGLSPEGGTNVGDPRGSVILPIQSPVSDSNTVGWSDGRLTGIEAAVFNVAFKGITEGLGKAADAAGVEFNRIVTSNEYNKALGVYFAQQASQINDVFARVTGGILNPNLELLFQGPELRSFNFAFKLSARDEPEADQIRQIIRFFKQGMSVKKAKENLFLKSPDIFEIKYYNGSGGEHKSLNRFKVCALRGFNVDYAPLGSYMTYDDAARTMVAYTINMQFQEIDPIYDDDYEKLGSNDIIGY